MIRPVWVMYGRMLVKDPQRGKPGEFVKQAIRCSGRQTPYIFRTREEAERNLDIAYPHERRCDRLDGTRYWYVEEISFELQLIADDMEMPLASRTAILDLIHDGEGSEDAFREHHDEFLGRMYPHLFGPS